MSSLSEDLVVEEIDRTNEASQKPTGSVNASLIAAVGGRPVWIHAPDNTIHFEGKEIYSLPSKAVVISAAASLIVVACEDSLECLQLSGSNLEICTRQWSLRLPKIQSLSVHRRGSIAAVAGNSLYVLEDVGKFSDDSHLPSPVIQRDVECCSWGQEYLAVGMQTGALDIYDFSMAKVNSIGGPQGEQAVRCTYVSWISEDDANLTVAYETKDEDEFVELFLFDMGSDMAKAPQTRSTLGDVIPFFRSDEVSHRFFTSVWNSRALIVAANLGSDIGLIVDGELLELERPYSFPIHGDEFLTPTGMIKVKNGIALSLTDGSVVTLALKHIEGEASFEFSPPSLDVTTVPNLMGSRKESDNEIVFKLSSIDSDESASKSAETRPAVRTSGSATTSGLAPKTLDGRASMPQIGTGVFGGGAAVPTFGSSSSGIPAIAATNPQKPSPFGFSSGNAPLFGADSNPFAIGSSPSPFASMAKPLFSTPSLTTESSSAPLSTKGNERTTDKRASLTEAAAPKSAITGSSQQKEESVTEEVSSKAITDKQATITQVVEPASANTGNSQSKEENDTDEVSSRAIKAFNSIDTNGTGAVSVEMAEALIEAVGEGFHGEEMNQQISKLDPESSGRVQLHDFIDWYRNLVSTEDFNDNDSEAEEKENDRNMAKEAFYKVTQGKGWIDEGDLSKLFEELNTTYCDEDHGKKMRKLAVDGRITCDSFLEWYIKWMYSDDEESTGATPEKHDQNSNQNESDVDEEEIREEKEMARAAFEKAAGDNKTWISLSDVPALFDDHLGTTYSEVDHGTKMKEIAVDGTIAIDAFLSWYIGWIFEDDEESALEEAEDNRSNDAKPQPLHSLFAAVSGWKCEMCFINNKEEDTKCVSCEADRPGAASDSAEAPSQANHQSGIGSSGFVFGGTVSDSPETTSHTNQQSSIRSSGFVFGASLEKTGVTSGGFTFGGSIPSGGSTANRQTTNPASSAFGVSLPDEKTQQSGIGTNGFSFGGSLTKAGVPSSRFTSGGREPSGGSRPPADRPGNDIASEAESPIRIKPGSKRNVFPVATKGPGPLLGDSTAANASAPDTLFGKSTTTTSAFATKLPLPVKSETNAFVTPVETKPQVPQPGSSSKATPSVSTGKTAAIFPLASNAPGPLFGKSNVASLSVAKNALGPSFGDSSAATSSVATCAPDSLFGKATATTPSIATKPPLPVKSETHAFATPVGTKPQVPLLGSSGKITPSVSTGKSAATPPVATNAPGPLFGKSIAATPSDARNAPGPSFGDSSAATSSVATYAPDIFFGKSSATTPLVATKPSSSKATPSVSTGKSAAIPPVATNASGPLFGKSIAATPPVARNAPDPSFGKESAAPPPEYLSDATKQYQTVVHRMQEQLTELHAYMPPAESVQNFLELKGERGRLFQELDQLSSFLDIRMSRSGEILCQNSGTKTIVRESRRNISSFTTQQQRLDDFNSQPLDSASQERREQLYEDSVRLKRCLDKLDLFLKVLFNQTATSEVLGYVVGLYKKVKDIGGSAIAMQKQLSELEGRHSSKKSTGGTRFRLTSCHPQTLVENEVERWNKMEARFANLPPKDQKHFELKPLQLSRKENTALLRLHDHAEDTTAPDQQRNVFSSPRSMNIRSGWDAESSVDHKKVTSSEQFYSPRELHKTSLKDKARESLSRFSTIAPTTLAKANLTKSLGSENNPASENSGKAIRGSVPSHRSSSQPVDTVNSSSHRHQDASSPDYRALLTEFFKENVPAKLSSVNGYLEKYKGRERELVAKVAEKYKAPGLLEKLKTAAQRNDSLHATAPKLEQRVVSTPVPTTSLIQSTPSRNTKGSILSPTTGDATTPSTSAPNEPAKSLPLNSSSSIFPGPTTQPAAAFGSPKGQTPFQSPTPSPFNAQTTPSPFGTQAPAPFDASQPSAEKLFNGKSAREMLTAFYTEKNPSKLGSIDEVLKKYKGNEEAMFANLAKKYKISPSLFGLRDSLLPPAPTTPGFGVSPAMNTGTPDFGKPSPLGTTTPVFGQASTLGNSAPAFGQTPPLGSAPVFGSSPQPFSSTPFGQTSNTGGFGALAKSPSVGFASLASPSQTPTPFTGSTPFGSARR